MSIPLAGAKTGNGDRDAPCRAPTSSTSRSSRRRATPPANSAALGGNQYAADGTLSLRGVSKPVTLTFTWTPGAKPVLAGKATVKRLDFGVGGGDWTDTDTIPNEVAVSTRVVLQPAK